ncbi:MAG: Gfo/Idh/MocA family oxidoreductase, partial [Duncaniella sp.]|nr:Gfo/Idh/MocA family oxidoreductase [Duncaniella sp.]
MKLTRILASVLIGVTAIGSGLSAAAQSLSPSTRWHWDKGTIVVDTPEREPGQESALGLTVTKIENVRVAFVGLGMRGVGAVERFSHIPGVQVVALCDYEPKRAERCQKYLKEAGLMPADIYSGAKGYEEICARPDVDLVYVATDWVHHFPVAKCARDNGKNTA